jgi:GWxTD domain-containing protein
MIWTIFLLAAAGSLFSWPAPAGQKRTLPSVYKKWLEEEVVYIISSLEKQVFEKLQTDRERDLFIEAFWRQRDPTPGTAENEFKTEHFRRVNHANYYLGRQSPIPGWKTDRGRIYIILGEPNDIQHYDSGQETYPAEVWFYQNKAEVGLPTGFYIVFFKEHGSGDYRLYSPTQHGPQALLSNYLGSPEDVTGAYRKLRDLEPNLAMVSLSLIPGDDSTAFGRASLSSDLLIQQVESLPERTTRDQYARKFLQYKDIVEVEYSANYLDSDSVVKILRAAPGMACIHYSIEPARLSVSEYGDKYSANLTVTGSVKDGTGKVIFQFDKTLPVSFKEEELRTISRQPYALYDVFPLIAGSYDLSILLKNEVSKEFSSVDRKLIIPAEEAGVWVTPLLLGYKANKVEAGRERVKPFQIGNVSLLVQANRTFTRTEELFLAFQVWGLPGNVLDKAEVEFTFLKDAVPFKTFTRTPAAYPGFPDIVEPVSLSEFLPAHYEVRVSVRADGRELASGRDEFDITPLEKIGRPWVYARIMPGPEDAVYPFLIGNQLFNSGRPAEARPRLEEAYRKRPEEEGYALALARTDMTLQDFSRVEALLLPFFGREKPPRYEVFNLLANAYHRREEWEKALKVIEQGISHYGLNTGFLNLRADCHLKLGNRADALLALEKSLELNPAQPEIQKAVEALKKKD